MEVKMNKEIMEYREAMFFGLDFRQMVCSLLAVLAAVGIYFGLRGVAGDEVTGWLCMAGAAPFAFCGFFRYHGMTAEQFAWAFIKSEFLYPKKLVYKPEDLYYQCLKERISEGESGKKTRKEKKSKKDNRRDRKRISPGRQRTYSKRMKKRKQMELKRRRQNRSKLDSQQKSGLDNRQKNQQKSRPDNRQRNRQKSRPDSRQRNPQKSGSDSRQRNPQKGSTDSRQKIQQKGRRIENRQKNRRDASD